VTLVVGVVRPRVRHIVQHVLSVHTVALRDGEETFGTEGSFGVDVETLAFAAFHVAGELWRSGRVSGGMGEMEKGGRTWQVTAS
jgi:hypothetical protein